jgi:hypothetical protein
VAFLAGKGVHVDISKVDIRTGGLWGWMYKGFGAGGAAGNTVSIRDIDGQNLTYYLVHELTHVADYQSSLVGLDYALSYVGQLVGRTIASMNLRQGYETITYEARAKENAEAYAPSF